MNVGETRAKQVEAVVNIERTTRRAERAETVMNIDDEASDASRDGDK
jgi:hypothetical protein